ncbi:hypothetical protein [Neobacillus niacini]|uniref:hypothetical protein n=1 Tax=Neobacillus niacini TaxID=86668 RepID=UPI0027D8A460|nr:hypothetical protein [Neobacillus niacini]
MKVTDKVVPALVIDVTGEMITAVQIISLKKGSGKNKDAIFTIGKPQGLRDQSAVLIRKVHQVSQENLRKHISSIPIQQVNKILSKRNIILEKESLHKEMHLLKRKILLGQMNNERTTEWELRLDKVLTELGYQHSSKRDKKDYKNYRQTPNKGYIKVYLGGR